MTVTNELPVTNVINVTIETTPQGLGLPNVNSVALFTTETPLNPSAFGQYQTYLSPGDAASDWATNSTTLAMLNAIFSQNPNVLTGDGQVSVLPLLSSVSATAGHFTTADISAHIAAFAGVSNGDLNIIVAGASNNLGNMNFTGVTTLAQIAQIIQNAAPSGITVTASSTLITITGNKVGAASTIGLGTYGGGGVDLTGASYLNTAAGVAVGGTNSTGETLVAAITRTQSAVSYCPVITNLNMEDAVIETTATAIQAMDKMFFPHFSSVLDIAGAITIIQQATETKTRSLLYTYGQSAANLMKSAYVGRACSTDFTGSNTAGTMSLKSLATIIPDTGINQTTYNSADAAGADLYVSYDGVPSVYSSGGNNYFDNVYMDLALKFALQTAGFNYLRQTNTKIPQTEAGMNGLKAAYAQVMDQFIRNGCLAPGAWNSPETFGPSPQIFLNNITQKGYYIYSLPVAQQSSIQRNGRVAPLVQIAGKRAGAIHKGNVIVLLNN